MLTNRNNDHNPLAGLLARRIELNWEVLAYIVIFVVAIFTRFYILGDRVMSHDESLHTRFSYDLYAEGNFRHTPLMHGPILFHATALSYSLFGPSDFSARIYTSILGVAMVMMPLLFRRWLGRWGALLASIMMLISPLMMYYHRYIREDTPSMTYALLMIWGILMYLNGPENQRRRPHWLYVVAAGMILNLGSKETAFIYVAILGIFLALYFFVRFAQYRFGLPGKPIFYFTTIGILLGAVLALGMYIIFDIIQFDLMKGEGVQSFAALPAFDQSVFFQWVFLAILFILVVILGSLVWAYRGRWREIRWGEVAVIVGLMFAICFALVVFEEVSHTTPTTSETAVAPAVPGEESEAATETRQLTWFPMLLVWGGSLFTFALLFAVRRRSDGGKAKDKPGHGFWGTLDLFPEFDLIIVIGTLILPWATALVPYLMRGTGADFAAVANALPPFLNSLILNIPDVSNSQQVGQVALSFMAWLPLMAISVAVGLAWDWRKWLIASGIFHLIFAFFFTTVFTNIAGLASGMVYSLGYWLEQQGVRRGSQPQYYYLLVVMPFYEFLPIVGSVLAMLAGMIGFWRWRLWHNEERAMTRARLTETANLDDAGLAGDPVVAVPDMRGASAMMMPDMGGRAGAGDGPADDEATYSTAIPEQDILAEEDISRRTREQRLLQQVNGDRLLELPFLILWSWLALFNLVGYSLAGEKMPWLGTHLTLPLIFLAAWFFGRIFERLEWRTLAERGWVAALFLVLAFITGAQVFVPFLIGYPPFSGLNQQQLQQTYSWVLSLLVFGLALVIILRQLNRAGWPHLRQLIAVVTFVILGGLTFRSAWMASFINYDYPTEYLVYAHAAPAVKTVLNQIEEISLRITDGKQLRFAWDNEVSWPYSWYFRDYPNAVYIGDNPTFQNLQDTVMVIVGERKRARVEPLLEDRYLRFDHMRLWWPMQDYFYLTPQRVLDTFDFSPENTRARDVRRGLFDIWWARDYSTYGSALDKNFEITRWPVSDRMHVYVRKDIAAQVWQYGVGDGSVLNPLDTIEPNLCTANWITPVAEQVILSPENLNRPLGMAIGPDGNLYVAEENANRISVFNSDGIFMRTIGMMGSETGLFIRPNSISVDSEGRLYVADTWNYRIQQLTNGGNPILAWGQKGEYGFNAPALPVDGFWGPRDVFVQGNRVYVADTGNKRIRVYELSEGEARYLFDVGRGGSALGELDEPSSILVHPADGRIFIADTWNRRISIFSPDGAPLTSFRVRGWSNEMSALPYMALDADRDLLYVTDADGGRVLVFNTAGDCIGAFGQLAGESATSAQLRVVSGIALDAEGSVYVADAALNRILRFPSFAILKPEALINPGIGAEGGLSLADQPALEDEFERDENGFIIPQIIDEAEEGDG